MPKRARKGRRRRWKSWRRPKHQKAQAAPAAQSRTRSPHNTGIPDPAAVEQLRIACAGCAPLLRDAPGLRSPVCVCVCRCAVGPILALCAGVRSEEVAIGLVNDQRRLLIRKNVVLELRARWLERRMQQLLPG